MNPSSKSDASSDGSGDKQRRIVSIEKVCIGGAMQRKVAWDVRESVGRGRVSCEERKESEQVLLQQLLRWFS